MLKDVSPYHLTGVGITERLVTLKNVSNSTLNIVYVMDRFLVFMA